MAETLRRTIYPEVRVLDEAQGLVEYVASDETLDRDGEVIRVKGWRFTNFGKNSPFVDGHDYTTIEKLLGAVVDIVVKGKQLIETVKWAKDVAENRLAQIGWNMTKGGFLKAVSVGILPIKMVTPSEKKAYREQLTELGLSEGNGPRRIFVEQEQTELSAVIVGANPNALAKAYKAEVLSESDLELISKKFAEREVRASAIDGPDAVAQVFHRAQEAIFLRKFEKAIKRLK